MSRNGTNGTKGPFLAFYTLNSRMEMNILVFLLFKKYDLSELQFLYIMKYLRVTTDKNKKNKLILDSGLSRMCVSSQILTGYFHMFLNALLKCPI